MSGNHIKMPVVIRVSVGSKYGAQHSQDWSSLDAPPVIVGARNWIIPAYEFEKYFFPQPEWIIDAIHEKILPLAGHTVTTNYTDNEKIRRNKRGI